MGKNRNLVLGAFGIGVFLLVAMSATELFSNVGGAPVARTGAPGETTCATSTCHANNINSGPGTLQVLSDAPGNQYSPGVTYTITVKLAEAGRQRYGFETIGGYVDASGGTTGTVNLLNATETQIKTFQGKSYVTHRQAGTAGPNDSISWSFEWTAPSTGVGSVSFYTTGNAANNNGRSSGDNIYSEVLTLFEGAVGTNDVTFARNAFRAYPTQASQNLHFEVKNAHFEGVNWSVMDLQGQRHLQGKSLTEFMDVRETVNISNLRNGLYFLQVEADGYREVFKFFKI